MFAIQCSSYACKKLPKEIEQLVRDIYNFIGNSPKRANDFDEIQKLFYDKPLKALHPSQTRWLSLESVVNRILKKYEPLLVYFQLMANSNDDYVAKSKAEHILTIIKKPVTKLFLEFLNYILPVINRLFQSESPQIQSLLPEINTLIKSILECYVPKNIIDASKNLGEVRFNDPRNYLPIEEIYLGVNVEAELLENPLSSENMKFFKLKCLDFYVELTAQLMKRFNLKDPILDNLSILNPTNIISAKNQQYSTVSSVISKLNFK